MINNNLWIIAIVVVAVVAIVALLGMITITGYVEHGTQIHAEHGSEIHTEQVECIRDAVGVHQICLDQWRLCVEQQICAIEISPQLCAQNLQDDIEECIVGKPIIVDPIPGLPN